MRKALPGVLRFRPSAGGPGGLAEQFAVVWGRGQGTALIDEEGAMSDNKQKIITCDTRDH